jgi:hypothetical protein
MFAQSGAVGAGRVSSANPNGWECNRQLQSLGPDLQTAQRALQIFFDIVDQRFERTDVNHLYARFWLSRIGQQLLNAVEKRR